MPSKGKKKATARRQEPPRQPERRQEPPRQPERRQELPRQPERRQETADRFTLVLPPELSNLHLNLRPQYHLAKLPHLNRGLTLNLAKLPHLNRGHISATTTSPSTRNITFVTRDDRNS